MRPYVLAASDLPAGWSITYSQPGDEFGSFGDSTCEGHAVEPAVVDRVRPTFSVEFTSPDGSLSIEQAAFRGEPQQMAADLAKVFAVDAACFGLESTEVEGGKTVFEPLQMPALADQQESASWRFLAAPDFKTAAVGHIVIARVGSIAMEISQIETLSSPDAAPTFTAAQFVALVEAAIARAKA